MNLFIILIVTTILIVGAVQFYFMQFDELDEYDDFECVVEPPKKGKR